MRAGTTRTRRWVAVLAGVALMAGCGGDDEPAAPPATTQPPPPPVFPLRGTPVDDAATAARPALVVKVDNDDRNARPQEGLADADVVYEEKVEGAVSRFAAVFHARQPAAVGPVRSGRTTDIAIVNGLNRPLYAFSGANPRVLGALRLAPLIDVGPEAAPQAYQRRGDRTAPYNLWADPARLREGTPPDAGPPPAAFTFGEAAPGGSRPATSVAYDFGPGGTRVVFTWDPAAGGWTRVQNDTPHVDTAGAPLTATNVVVQLVEYVDTGDRDVAGAPVPEAQLSGSGPAWVLTRGSAVRTTWSRPDPSQPTRLGDGGGVPLAPGPTWVALVPATGAGVTVSSPDGTPLT